MTSFLLIKREKESLKIMNISFQSIKIVRFFKEMVILFLKAKLFLDVINIYVFISYKFA